MGGKCRFRSELLRGSHPKNPSSIKSKSVDIIDIAVPRMLRTAEPAGETQGDSVHQKRLHPAREGAKNSPIFSIAQKKRISVSRSYYGREDPGQRQRAEPALSQKNPMGKKKRDLRHSVPESQYV